MNSLKKTITVLYNTNEMVVFLRFGYFGGCRILGGFLITVRVFLNSQIPFVEEVVKCPCLLFKYFNK